MTVGVRSGTFDTHAAARGFSRATRIRYETESPSALRKAWVEHAYRTVLVTFGSTTPPMSRIEKWFPHGDELILLAKKYDP